MVFKRHKLLKLSRYSMLNAFKWTTPYYWKKTFIGTLSTKFFLLIYEAFRSPEYCDMVKKVIWLLKHPEKSFWSLKARATRDTLRIIRSRFRYAHDIIGSRLRDVQCIIGSRLKDTQCIIGSRLRDTQCIIGSRLRDAVDIISSRLGDPEDIIEWRDKCPPGQVSPWTSVPPD